MSKKILLLSDYFFPAYKAGGPITSLKSLCAILAERFDMTVMTSNRDIDGSKLNTESNEFNYKVHYNSPFKFLLRFLFLQTKYDLIYINSIFSFKYSILPLLIIFLKRVDCKVIIAPRGEFSPSALGFGTTKKRLYLFLFKRLYINRIDKFHFTSNQEYEDFVSLVGDFKEYVIIPNPNGTKPKYFPLKSPIVKFVYFGRISPIKNLHFAIEVLSKLEIPFIFDIYGPIGDDVYWRNCLTLLRKFNIDYTYHGSFSGCSQSILKEYHFCLVPSLSENFGHVVYEALASSTPVIVSTNTPWISGSISTGFISLALNLNDWHQFLSIFEFNDANYVNDIRFSAFEYISTYNSIVDLRSQYLNNFIG